MERTIHMLGWYLEQTDAGPQIVLVQPYTHPDGQQESIEHEAASPEELWEAFCAIAEDPGGAPDVEPAGQAPTTVREELMRAGMSEAEAFIERNAGPIAGRIAGAMLRNPEHVKAVGQTILAKLGKVSWNDREIRTAREPRR